MTTTLHDWLTRETTADASRLGALADSVCTLVRVRRSRWRGRRRLSEGKVVVGDREVDPDVVSTPNWNFLPKALKDEFQAMEVDLKRALDLYSVGGAHSDHGEMEALVGNGVYVVDTACWPRLKDLLDAAAEKWAAAADAWCTEEGYAKLLAELEEKHGEEFADRRHLIPDREELRAKFGLQYAVLPVRLAPDPGRDAGVPAAAHGRAAVLVEALEAAVREPRVKLADALNRFADVVTRRPGPESRIKVRTVRKDTVLTAIRAVRGFTINERFADEALDQALERLLTRLPQQDNAASEYARLLTESEEDAGVVAGLARAAAAAATDESGMIAALAAQLDP